MLPVVAGLLDWESSIRGWKELDGTYAFIPIPPSHCGISIEADVNGLAMCVPTGTAGSMRSVCRESNGL